MLNTYLNDNQHRPYPLYGGVKLPFPASCITGIGLCIQEGDNDAPVYASVIAISSNSIRIALCRSAGPDSGADEFIGMLYANTNGYYTYVASSATSTVYEVNQIVDPVDVNRLVFASYTELPPDEEAMNTIALSDMQVFYSFVSDVTQGITRSSAKSTGYMQLGTISEDAVGVYTGRFYLDPSCITYMPPRVLGYHTNIETAGAEAEISHAVEITFNGLLTASVTGGTLLIGTMNGADDSVLNAVPQHGVDFIEYLNGITTSALEVLEIPDYTDQIVWSARETDKAVILTVDGTTAFPNCWGAEDDVHAASY